MMKKKALVFIFFIFCFSTFGNSKVQFNKFLKNRMYFSAYTSLFQFDSSVLSRAEIENVLSKIDPSILMYDSRLLKMTNVKGMEYALAVINMKNKRYDLATKYLLEVRNKKLLPYVNFLTGEIQYKTGSLDGANRSFLKCSVLALNELGSDGNTAIFYNTLYGMCMKNISRIFYEKGQFKTALKYSKKIKQSNYVWPQTLLDTAWAHYWNKDYNRSLGTLLSFKLDILTKFFEPEVTYLRALIYFELCYYNRSEAIVNNFNEKVFSTYPDLVKLLKLSYSLDANSLEKKLADSKYDYLSKFLEQVKNSYKFKKFAYYNENLTREINLLEKHKTKKVYSEIYASLSDYQKAILYTKDQYVKKNIYDYALKIKMAQKQLTKLKLNLNLKKRKLVRSSNEEEFDKEIINKSVKGIKDSQNKYIWEFKGGFWIDEMGDYAIAVDNKCK